MQATERSLSAKQPYPGLRSFEAAEAILFHGRDRHTEELLRRLSQNRFLAVVGGSGSGKSSLVRAGLMPALYRGYLVGATSRWRLAVMRPGSAPLAALSTALAHRDALGTDAQVRESSYGLVNTVRAASLSSGESLLLVVDQFEELFRFRRENVHRDGGAEAALFVSQLLQAADEFGVSIYVVLTMRSDFLGDCAQFPGLPEALNRGQYLIPRMTREQRREAITDSLDFFDATMSDRLVQRLLNDAGDDPDQLPVLQHALQQTYAIWDREGRKGEIDLEHYRSAGTMQNALHKHAQRVYESTENNAWIVERIFRCLTVDENGRAVRRPAKFERILRVIGVAGDPEREAEVERIIVLFAAPENCFLLWGLNSDLRPDSVVDISHESLIRKWTTLQEWVRDEAKGVDIYRYLRRDTSLYPADAGLWDDPDLTAALRAKKAKGWNEAWAEQYSQGPGASYAKVEEFLELSVRQREQKRRREVRYSWLKVGVAVLLLVIVVVAIKYYQSERENRASEDQRKELLARNQSLEAGAGKLSNDVNELQQQISAIEGKANTDAASLADLRRLQDEKQSAEKMLAEREKLIAQNKQQAAQTGQDYSESLKRINDLQGQLKQAWDERDRAKAEAQTLRSESSKGASSKGEPDAATTLRRQLSDSQDQIRTLQAENTRLKEAAGQASVAANADNVRFIPFVVPQNSLVPYGTAQNFAFAFALGELGSSNSSTARLYVLLPKDPLKALPNGGKAITGGTVPVMLSELSRNTPCPTQPMPNSSGYCFIVSKERTNSQTQQLGTINLGQYSFTFYAMGWIPNAIGGTDVLNVGVVAEPARTGSVPYVQQQQQRPSAK